mgnify:CR=1 FL=1
MSAPDSVVPPQACALTIAGSDPTGGAGLQMDLQVFALHDVHGMAVPTALTVQTTSGVQRTLPVFTNIVGEQLSALLGDIRPAAIKLGMLASDDVLLRVASVLDGHADIPRVVDPVLLPSPAQTLAALVKGMAGGKLVHDFWRTVERTAYATAIAAVVWLCGPP